MEHVGTTPVEGPLVRKLLDQGIRDPRLLAAFTRVPREAFVPERWRHAADGDHPLDIGYAQTISQPFIVAVMTDALELYGAERVLEIGTGSGYQTAILAEMLPDRDLLHTVEIVPALAGRAELTLRALEYDRIEFRVGDGALGWPEAAPYDAILVAAAPALVPPALLDQLAPGGRLVIPVGADPDTQVLELWRRDALTGALERSTLMRVRFVPLTHEPDQGAPDGRSA